MEREELAEKNIGLYMSFLKKFSTPWDFHTEQEYKQDILISFYRAAKKFDPSNGACFSTYSFKIMFNARRKFFDTVLTKTKIMNNKMHSLELYLETKDKDESSICKDLAIEEPDEGQMVPLVQIFRNYVKKTTPRISFILTRRADGTSCENIAKSLGCSKQNVHMILSNQIKKIRKFFKQD